MLRLLQFSWNSCGDTSYRSNITQLTLKPDPLKLPGNVTLGFSGYLDMDLKAPLKVSFVCLLVRPKAIACGADSSFTPDVFLKFFFHSRNLRDA